jgi:hypothetical protein
MSHVVIRPVEASLLVNIDYRHHDPEFAALAANTIAEEYASQNLERRFETTKNKMDWIERELAAADQRARESEDALAQYREDRNAQSLEDRTNVVVTRLNELNTQWLNSQAALRTASSQWNQVANADPRQDSADLIPLIGMAADVVRARGEEQTLSDQSTRAALRRSADTMRKLKIHRERAAGIDCRALPREGLRDGAEPGAAACRFRTRRRTSRIRQEGRGIQRPEGRRTQAARRTRRCSPSPEGPHRRQQQGEQREVVDRAQVPTTPVTPNTEDLISAILAGLTRLGLAFEPDTDDTVTPEDVTKRLGRWPRAGRPRDAS